MQASWLHGLCTAAAHPCTDVSSQGAQAVINPTSMDACEALSRAPDLPSCATSHNPYFILYVIFISRGSQVAMNPTWTEACEALGHEPDLPASSRLAPSQRVSYLTAVKQPAAGKQPVRLSSTYIIHSLLSCIA